MKRILLVADQPGWIFERHCKEIKKRMPEYSIDITFHKQDVSGLSLKHDLVYVLDPMPMFYPKASKTILGLRCEFLFREHPAGAKGLYESGFPGRCVSIKDKCCIFHVVNRNQLNVFKDIVTDKPLLLAQHGIDEEVFDRDKFPRIKHDGIHVGVSGRDSKNKAFNLIAEACKKVGFQFVNANYYSRISKDNMPLFYSGVDIYVCMSLTEGLNNGIMEAGAMGVPVISTRCGASEEMIEDGVGGFLIDRNVESLCDALVKMKDDKIRCVMGDFLREEMMKNWTWKVRIEDFRKMFQLYFEKKNEND